MIATKEHYDKVADLRNKRLTYEGLLEEGLYEEAYRYRMEMKL